MQHLDSDDPEQPHDTPATEADVRAEDEDALSGDAPLPSVYQRDQISLMVQGPDRLYLYWRFAHDPDEPLLHMFGTHAVRFRLTIKLVETENESATYHDAAPSGEYWFNGLLPGCRYRAEVGQLAPGGPFISLLRSEVAHTPRGRVAAVDDVPPTADIHPQLGPSPAAPDDRVDTSAAPTVTHEGAAGPAHMNYALGPISIEPPEVF
jgi:hypothetical protein